jgi:hypothetical protein
MISFLKLSKKTYFLLFFSIAFLILLTRTAYCSTYPFDEYAVFCCYFKISGDKPTDQDIEELCFTFDRPTYTSFKPSEMFTKRSLLKEKNRVDKKIKSITCDSTYLWIIKSNLSNIKDIDRYFSMAAIAEILPQPTPYINARISRKGQRKIKKAISSLLKKYPEKIKKKDVEILITVKPEKSEYGYQKRNIVQQKVFLPIRYVIFQPLKVQILDELEMVE